MAEINLDLLKNMAELNELLNSFYAYNTEGKRIILERCEGIFSNNKLFLHEHEDLLEEIHKKEKEYIKEFRNKMKEEKEKIEKNSDDPISEKDAYTIAYLKTRLWVIEELYKIWDDIINNRLV